MMKRKIDFSPDLLGVTKLADAVDRDTKYQHRIANQIQAGDLLMQPKGGKNDWRIDMQDLTALFAKTSLAMAVCL